MEELAGPGPVATDQPDGQPAAEPPKPLIKVQFGLRTVLILMIGSAGLYATLGRTGSLGENPAALVCLICGGIIGTFEIQFRSGIGPLRGRAFNGAVGGTVGAVFFMLLITLMKLLRFENYLPNGWAVAQWTLWWMYWGAFTGAVIGGISAWVQYRRFSPPAPTDEEEAAAFLKDLQESSDPAASAPSENDA